MSITHHMKYTRSAFAIALLSAAPCHAQEEPRARDYGNKVLIECRQLTDEQWETSLTKLATVPLGDSLYERTLLMRCGILSEKEKWDALLTGAEEGIRIAGPLEHYFHVDKASALTSMGRYEEGMAHFDQCIARYTGSFMFPYLKALAAAEHKDHALALGLLKDLVRGFPLDPRGHAALARIARKEGRTAQAAMAYAMSLMVSWEGPADESRLVEFDRAVSAMEPDPQGYDLSTDDDFAEVDLLLKNRVAMESKYKMRPDVEYPMCRQSHLLFSFLGKNNTGTGFWSSYYAPIFRRIMSEDLFDGFVYHCLASSSNEKVNALAKKNSAIVLKFRQRIGDLLMEMYQTFPDSTGAQPTRHWYYADGGLEAVGMRQGAEERYTGVFTTYHPSGAISARGVFGDNNQRTGLWLEYHPNGAVSKRAAYVAGLEDGVLVTYGPQGTILDSMVVVDRELNGPYNAHTAIGGLRLSKHFARGKSTGPVTEYYPCGTVENRYTMTDDLLDGPGESFFPDGRKQYDGSYSAGARSGMHTTWHHNGRKASEQEFTGGKPNGPFKEWHPNGQLSAEGARRDGELTGPYRSYAADGIPKEEATYDDNGRPAGISRTFSDDGTLYMEQEFQHGLLVRYRYFDRKGGTLDEGERKKGRFQLTGSSPDGNKNVSGIYLDEGLKDGTWTYFAEDGTIISEERFVKGELAGAQRSFDGAGRLEGESDYSLPERTGPYKRFYPDGKPKYIGWSQKGALNGALRHYLPDGTLVEDLYLVDGDNEGWQRYFDVDGTPLYSERIENGIMREKVRYDATGKEYERYVVPAGRTTLRETYPTGEPLSAVETVNGKPHGKAVYYYANGKISAEGRYVNGERDSTWYTYHPSGVRSSEKQWELGKHTGVDRVWYDNGTLRSEEAFENDEMHGPFHVFDRNGQMILERQRIHDMEHGTARSWTSTGALQLFRYYDHDRLYAYASPRADGTAGDTIPLPQGIQEMRSTFPDGHTSREMRMRNGEIDGVYREFYPTGGLMEETPYSVGRITGVSVEYYPEGGLRESTAYVMGMRHGAYLRNGPNGKPLEEATFRYDELHGEQKKYDSTGKLLATYVYRSGDLVAIK
jgi:antitoxin component YwqK of YwqJK toxin-antitoxin module